MDTKILKDKFRQGALPSEQDYASLIDAIGPVSEDTLKNIELDLDGYDEIEGGIRDYFKSPLNDLRTQILDKDDHVFNLGFGTDYHYDSASAFQLYPENTTPREKLIDYMGQGLRKSLNILSLSDILDTLVFNGDNVDQPTEYDLVQQRLIMYKQHKDFANTAFSLAKCPVFLMKGNHDSNHNMKHPDLVPKNVIHDSDFKLLYKQNGSQGEIRKDGSNYFYKDFPEKSVRLIGLDTSDSPETVGDDGSLLYDRFHNSYLQQAQLDWLANTALQNTEGLTIVITLHFSVNHTVGIREDQTMINHDVLKTILADFVTGGVSSKTVTSTSTDFPATVTYSFNNAGIIAGVLGGHYHYDNYKRVDNINYILSRCSLLMGDNVLKEKRLDYAGTALEDSFDIFSIDTHKRTISTIRFGAGSEDTKYATRSWSY